MKTKLTLFLSLVAASLFAQASDTVIFSRLGEYKYSGFSSVFSPRFDRLGRNYVYAAGKDAGLAIFDISNPMVPTLNNTITSAQFGGLKPTNLVQDSNYLYVSLGDFQGNPAQTAGLAIVDISTPTAPVIKDIWDSAVFNHGTAGIDFEGNYVFLGAMKSGVLTLDVSNKNNIVYVSQFIPDTSFAPSGNWHARDLEVRNDTLCLAFDAGGFSVINVANKLNPVQIGKYINTNLTAVASAAYNDVARVGNYAYVPVDYCGLEVINMSNVTNMQSAAWTNPWNCNGLSWFGSDGNTNEIFFLPGDSISFVSGGDTEILAFNSSNPSQANILGTWGPPNDSVGSWGLDVRGNMAAIGLIHIPVANLPFTSDTGGLQLVSFGVLTAVHQNTMQTGTLNMFPNPASNNCTIVLPASTDPSYAIDVIDIYGRTVRTQTADPRMNHRQAEVNLEGLATGVYTIRVTGKNVMYSGRVVKE